MKILCLVLLMLVFGKRILANHCGPYGCTIPPSVGCKMHCEHGGVCNDAFGVCKCLTGSGWAGDSCNEFTCYDKCAQDICIGPNSCMFPDPVCVGGCGYGTCEASGRCRCDEGYTGANCDKTTRINECRMACNNGICIGNIGKCQCFKGWTGDVCTTPHCPGGCGSGYCKTSGKCVCGLGYEGPNCTKKKCTSRQGCVNGNCDKSVGFCNCNNGYGGVDCGEPVCPGGCGPGTCKAPGLCDCPRSYTGHNCGTKSCTPGYGCGTHSNCDIATSTCKCKMGWTGWDCDKPKCDGGCGPGTCVSPGFCSCPTTHAGPKGCTRKCNSGLLNSGCKGNSFCDANTGYCKCNPGWIGRDCKKPLCVGGCGPGKCINYGQCSCPKGFVGPKCVNKLCSEGCKNSKCDLSTGTCKCNKGYEGPECNEAICPGGCNKGSCYKPGHCLCPEGYTGSKCDSILCDNCPVNSFCSGGICECHHGWRGIECDEKECRFGSGCNGNGGCDGMTGTCNCNQGWEGPECDKPKCSGGCGPGSCDSPSVCSCPEDYSGYNCERKHCKLGCWNGECDPYTNTCKCKRGWTGSDCEKPVCPNGCGPGTCIEPETCHCPASVTGSRCETDVSEDSDCKDLHLNCPINIKDDRHCTDNDKKWCPKSCHLCGTEVSLCKDLQDDCPKTVRHCTWEEKRRCPKSCHICGTGCCPALEQLKLFYLALQTLQPGFQYYE